MNLIGHSNGPGIAASVILLTLIDELTRAGTLKAGDKARILADADALIAQWGVNNTAVKDARLVLDKLRGPGA